MSIAAYFTEQVWPPFSESVLDWDESFHDLMLNDRLRMTAYRKAIFETVRPGDTVLDLGTGTGILSQWALEAGARRVYGVGLNPEILALATARIGGAGFADRFEPINQLSFEVMLPARVDVLISEIIGNLADNEDFQPILQDAIQRFVAPHGKILPMTTASYVAPVAAPLAHRQVQHGAVAQLTSRYDVAALYRAKQIRSPFDLYYDCILPRSACLARPAMLRAYHGAWDQPATYRCERRFAIERPGRLTGFKGYFVAELTATTRLDISGDDIAGGETSDSWKHAYLPIEHPIDVAEGDRLELCVSRRYPDGGRAFRQIYDWRGAALRDGRVIGQFAHSMDGGGAPG